MYFCEGKEQTCRPRLRRGLIKEVAPTGGLRRVSRETMAISPYGRGEIGGDLRLAAGSGLVANRSAQAASGESFESQAHRTFRDFVLHQDFPCVGARAAFNSSSYVLKTYEELGSAATTAALCRVLCEFTRSEIRRTSEYATFVAVFKNPRVPNEVEFETRMWEQLAQLNRVDAEHFEWDASVRSDPADPQFSFSFGGHALYVIGMHPNSSRLARRFKWPAMIFNPHEQFERLRTEGKWKRTQQTIRERDIRLQGSVNPMLSDFGQSSEARQYSGRVVEENWRPPFKAAKPRKCPFHR